VVTHSKLGHTRKHSNDVQVPASQRALSRLRGAAGPSQSHEQRSATNRSSECIWAQQPIVVAEATAGIAECTGESRQPPRA
jgi:hypothetical protein